VNVYNIDVIVLRKKKKNYNAEKKNIFIREKYKKTKKEI